MDIIFCHEIKKPRVIAHIMGLKNCYNISMYNWSVDEKYLRKFPNKYKLWCLEQTISYGLDGDKLKKKK